MLKRKNRNQKSKKSSFLKNPKLLTFIFVLFIVFLSVPLVKKTLQKREVNEEIKKMQNEISEREQENKELDKLIQYLESEHFLEEQARLNLGLKKKGEKVLVIKEEGIVAGIKEQGDVGNDKFENNKSQLGKWLDYFFKKD
ncbi:septum formation initiator family protein [bacterium]|nr:septum formation initiator family protein [bacterium]